MKFSKKNYPSAFFAKKLMVFTQAIFMKNRQTYLLYQKLNPLISVIIISILEFKKIFHSFCQFYYSMKVILKDLFESFK